jgi:hypothetical protein
MKLEVYKEQDKKEFETCVENTKEDISTDGKDMIVRFFEEGLEKAMNGEIKGIVAAYTEDDAASKKIFRAEVHPIVRDALFDFIETCIREVQMRNTTLTKCN